MTEIFGREGFAGAPPSHAEEGGRHPDTPQIDWPAALDEEAVEWHRKGYPHTALTRWWAADAIRQGAPVGEVLGALCVSPLDLFPDTLN